MNSRKDAYKNYIEGSIIRAEQEIEGCNNQLDDLNGWKTEMTEALKTATGEYKTYLIQSIQSIAGQTEAIYEKMLETGNWIESLQIELAEI